MGNRVVIALRPKADPGQASAGIEIDRINAATHLGRHQQNPIAKASAADIGPGIDQFALDIMTLGFGVGVAGVAWRRAPELSGP